MPAASLPDDVLTTIFDTMDVRTLCNCSHISRHWRATARHHPTFWKTLSISDRNLTLGTVEFFLDRLNARTGDEEIISLTLRFTRAHCLLMRDLVIPAVATHTRRCEKIVITVSGLATEFVWPLFSIAAPRLRVLRVWVLDADACPHNVPALMFNVAAYSSLEYVVLEDVPLPQGLKPVAHTIKSYVVKYSYFVACIREALAWIPRTHSFGVQIDTSDLWPPTTSIDRLLVENYPFLAHVTRLIVHDDRLLRLPVCTLVPVMGIHMSAPRPNAVLRVLPPGSLLCMSLRTTIYHTTRRGSPTQRQRGVLTATNVDRTVIRCCHGLSVAHMTSRTFLGQLVATERLVLLDVELHTGFLQMCRHLYVLPQLRVLCVVIDGLQDGTGDNIDYGRLGCPTLRTLAFERANRVTSVDITRAVVEVFIENSLNLEDGANLDIILRDVRMSGSESAGGRISRVRHQAVAVERAQPGELTEQMIITRLAWMFSE
ncbi:hypothetical protein AURDEDRAFT_177727 [Auricularia subglabra TFB-10046 SS5]|uniref:F-box domain-containing protein n=1 Tax=Auricularia subglabra (strain TFB-10046 / SS5) TaxID=717982 RepID=J0CSD9_AURST|nr:hypothetical protein AURDEDRAFT_177727 [Auricularia subglabra TFB-10046 SS5]